MLTNAMDGVCDVICRDICNGSQLLTNFGC